MESNDDLENNAKISDSAYSNSCNSQSRRSNSSKSTHCGSHSSASSGYGGNPSNMSGSSGSKSQTLPKKSKDKSDSLKKKKSRNQGATGYQAVNNEAIEAPVVVPEQIELEDIIIVDDTDVFESPVVADSPDDAKAENEENDVCVTDSTENADANLEEGFSFIISMSDGVILYATPCLTNVLGYLEEMWVGRSFINFIHPKDQATFASQISSHLTQPQTQGKNLKDPAPNTPTTMFCRLRKYRGLTRSGFGVTNKDMPYSHFKLTLYMRDVEAEDKGIYLVIQATPVVPIYKVPNETIKNATAFTTRHIASGNMEYIDPESIKYLGYLPQDIVGQNALNLYHPEDLPYLTEVYEIIVKEGSLLKGKPYRLQSQNGDYVRLETEWSSFVNPWSRKLEIIIGNHKVIEGPENVNVFQTPEVKKVTHHARLEKMKAQIMKDRIIVVMGEVLTKPAEVAKQQMNKRCHDLSAFMETFIDDSKKVEEELHIELPHCEQSFSERNSFMLGGISPHHESYDSKSSTETPLSYNQLSYKDNLQRYFNSNPPTDCHTNANPSILNGDKPTAEPVASTSNCISPKTQEGGHTHDSRATEFIFMQATAPRIQSPDITDFSPHARLTEELLMKHDAEMTKALVRKHREARIIIKTDRDKNSESRHKKKREHLARCNTTYRETEKNFNNAQDNSLNRNGKDKSQIQKSLHQLGAEHPANPAGPPYQQASTSRAQFVPMQDISPLNTMPAPHNTPIPMHSLGPAMPNMVPMYFIHSPHTPMPYTSPADGTGYHQNVQYIMYPPMYGQPLMYSPIPVTAAQFPAPPHISCPSAHNHHEILPQSMKPLQLDTRNYAEACRKLYPQNRPKTSSFSSRNKNYYRSSHPIKKPYSKYKNTYSKISDPSLLSSEDISDSSKITLDRFRGMKERRMVPDGTSSSSSFYSSFMKTDSGSNEDSDGPIISTEKRKLEQRSIDSNEYSHNARKKTQPPWMDQVNSSSKLVYRYQVEPKNLNDVLENDMKKLNTYEQPDLVNEQLEQLYKDLQLEGVAERLTLEDGITSSASSGEESTGTNTEKRQSKYAKLMMIYEEDGPLPSPIDATPLDS